MLLIRSYLIDLHRTCLCLFVNVDGIKKWSETTSLQVETEDTVAETLESEI